MYKIHLEKNEEGKMLCGGFYNSNIHSNIPLPNITITDELWKYLLSMCYFEFIGTIEDKTYTIEDEYLFKKIIISQENTESQNPISERLSFLESEHLQNVSSILDLDFRVTDIEFTIESPMTLNLKNTKGEIKTMARTPYEMMKTLIIAGEYDEVDMTHKINRYYEMGKITLDQKEELLGLIEANKVIG